MLLNHVTGWNIAVLIVLINAPFIWLGYKQISGILAVKSIFSILAFAIVLYFIEVPRLTNDKLLIAIFGGIFLGAGIGYRIFNTSMTQWSVQAGPGYRTAKVVDQEDVSEAAASVSSNVFRSLSENSYVTNDTDVIYSETATTLVNELALNTAMTDVLSLRTSLTTSFNDSTDDTLSDGVNTFGVSVIYNFE